MERWAGGEEDSRGHHVAQLNTACSSGKTGRWLHSEAKGLRDAQAFNISFLRIWVQTGGPLPVFTLGSRYLEWALRKVEWGRGERS